MRQDIEQALRPVVCLPNPSRMQAARWERAGFRGACAAPPESKRAATAGSPCGTGRAVGRSQRASRIRAACGGEAKELDEDITVKGIFAGNFNAHAHRG